MACDSIDELIYSGKGIAVLKTSFVQIDEVNKHSQLCISFLHQNGIGQPFKIVDFSDKASASYLSTSSVMTFCRSGAKFLFFCFIGRWSGSTSKQCTIISGPIPDISVADQAKM